MRRQDAALVVHQRNLGAFDLARAQSAAQLAHRFDDTEQSWYHIDLTTGVVVQRLTRIDRWARWLYNGLHSFDFAPLFQLRPLWDATLILLLLCGFVFSISAVVIGWRRVRA